MELDIIEREIDRIMLGRMEVYDHPVVCVSTDISESRTYGKDMLAIAVDRSRWRIAGENELRYDGDIQLSKVQHQWLKSDEGLVDLPDKDPKLVWVYHGTNHKGEIMKSGVLKGGDNHGGTFE